MNNNNKNNNNNKVISKTAITYVLAVKNQAKMKNFIAKHETDFSVISLQFEFILSFKSLITVGEGVAFVPTDF